MITDIRGILTICYRRLELGYCHSVLWIYDTENPGKVICKECNCPTWIYPTRRTIITTWVEI